RRYPRRLVNPDHLHQPMIHYPTRPTITGQPLRRIDFDSSWQPPLELQKRSSDKILHNLPLVDYEDTGLIGRDSEVKELAKRLIRRRRGDSILTVVGEGGIGKTALALEVAYNILDDPDSPYECILWVSLKTERLSGTEVQQITGAVRDLTHAANIIGQTFDLEFSGEIAELAEALEGIETLLIIDNLETVSGDDVIELYETLPDSVNYLFTSRIGIGQVERRVHINPLADKHASRLLRDFAGWRGLTDIAKWNKQTVDHAVAQLMNSPLRIRWYILAIESGQQPNLALSNQEELLDFCVRSVYDGMAPQSREILKTLSALNRSVTFDELAVLTELRVDALRSAIHDLQSGSLVASESDRENQLVSRFRLTESADQYLRRVSPPESAATKQILKREQDFRRSEERRRSDEEARFLSPNVVRIRNEHDKPAAHYLRLALLAYRKESLDRAMEHINRARELNPEFWEVYRVEAFTLSTHGHISNARGLYKEALQKCTDGQSRAIVSHFFSGHLAKKEHAPEEAIEYARESHEFFQHPETAQNLGNLLVWLRKFEQGQELILWALEQSKGKFRLITLTSLVDSWRRWADYLREDEHQPVRSAGHAYTGFSNGAREISAGTSDVRLANSVLESASTFIRAVTSTGVDASKLSRECLDILHLIQNHISIFEKTKSWSRISSHLGKLYHNKTTHPSVASLCSDLRDTISNPVSLERDPEDGLVGRISSWQKTYGFISHPKYPDGVFVPAAHIDGLTERGEDVNLSGRRIRFVTEPVDDGLPRAVWSILL
ncbi:NB-ARC domain-containing protein, partial [Saccharopolyspora sp. NPDC002376]